MKMIILLLCAFVMILGLAACGGSSAPEAGTESNDSGQAAETESAVSAGLEEAEEKKVEETIPDLQYCVSVTDPDGNPVPGVTVEFCDDAACRTENTDEIGTAVFTAKQGSYSVKVLEVPEGFVGTDEQFSVTDTSNEIAITLEILQPAQNEPVFGFSYYYPEKYESIKDKIRWSTYRDSNDLFEVHVSYCPEKNMDLSLFVLAFAMMDDSAAEEMLRAPFQEAIEKNEYILEKVGSAEGVCCFLLQKNSSRETIHQYFSDKEWAEDLYEEYVSLYEDRETFISGIKLHKPTRDNFLFETKDMDGNAINMADVFAGHKVTMINCWATWCNPCIKELSQLQKLSKTFEEKDCQIIGLCSDLHMKSDPAEAVSILQKKGVTYLNVVAPDEDHLFYKLVVYPTTYFVDSEGRLLSDPIFGADLKGYSKALDKILTELEG